MRTRITFLLAAVLSVCCRLSAQPTSETRPPRHPTNTVNQPHHIDIRADDWGAAAKRFHVIIRAKDKKAPLEDATGHLSIQDGDKFVSGCEVMAKRDKGTVQFEFSVGAGYLESSRFAFSIATASEKARKKMASESGWETYAFLLRDFVAAGSPIVVEGQRLTFDPKTCTKGTGSFFWGNGSVRVTVLGHKDGHCVFDYQWEVEGAGNYVVHRIKIPADSGPVVIDAGRSKGKKEHHWSIVFTSFTEKQATLIRRASFGWLEELVEGTGEFVAYQTTQRVSPEKEALEGEKLALLFTVFASKDFEQPLAKDKPGHVVTLTVGHGEDWKWARVASAGMALGEVRRVRLPARIAGEAKAWHPGAKDDQTLFLEMQRIGVKEK